MKSARLRLVGAILLFTGWIGWLGYLALTTTQPLLLSRPQFLVSQLDVIAVLQANDGAPSPDVEVEELFWPLIHQDQVPQRIRVLNLPDLTREDGWDGPGRYILPLVKDGDQYRLASIPLSPGFKPPKEHPRIYRYTPQTLEQLNQIRSQKSELLTSDF